MDTSLIEGLTITPLKVIETDKGAVRHIMKKSSPEFAGFGEAYFSEIDKDAIKGWKKHTAMVMNLSVAEGEVQFVFYDDRETSSTCGQFSSITLSLQNYYRITVSPGIWTAFKGLGAGPNRILNIGSIEHNPDEVEQKPIDAISYNW